MTWHRSKPPATAGAIGLLTAAGLTATPALAGPSALENIDTGETFATIQAAIDDADTLDGHTLQMLVAAHAEGPQVHFTKGLTLLGLGGSTTLTTTGDTAASGDARAWFLTAASTDVTFRDLVFDGTGFLVGQGIRNHGTLTVEGCDFTNIQYNASGPNYAGIAVGTFDADGLMTIRDCTFSNIGRIGVHIFEEAIVEDCVYTGKGDGDFLDYFSCVDSFGASIGRATFRNCTVTDCRGVASVDGSGSAALLVTTFFGPGTEAVITDSKFTANAVGLFVGFDALDTSSVVANFNDLAGNTFAGAWNASPLIVVDARENWWGDAGGPDDDTGVIPAVNGVCGPVAMLVNANPAGDAVSDENVEYCPWAEQSLCPPDAGTLSLELEDCPDDANGAPGFQIEVEVWMRDLTTAAAGFQAFLEFDAGVLGYRSDLSSYSSGPFPEHVQDIATAEVATGMIRIDGSAAFGTSGTVLDSRLATLVFDVLAECTQTSVDFDLGQPFPTELSANGLPIPTTLVNTALVLLDDTPPTVGPCPDVTSVADANIGDGCVGAIVIFPDPPALDTCDPSVDVECVPPSGSQFPVGTTTVTCTATDDCGNTDVCTFDVEVTAENTLLLDVELVGALNSTSRCIKLVLDDCTTVEVALPFDTNGMFFGSITIPCGSYTTVCGKDEQHTLWDTAPLTVGTAYGASLSLLAGDTDNDGDVDINDVTYLLATFGDLAAFGSCPYDGVTRDADFSNNGAVASEDYSLMTTQWLLTTACSCTSASERPASKLVSIDSAALPETVAARADRNRDGVVDFVDVEMFERANGLPNTLSRAIKRSAFLSTRVPGG
jgi:hypothetical protein